MQLIIIIIIIYSLSHHQTVMYSNAVEQDSKVQERTLTTLSH